MPKMVPFTSFRVTFFSFRVTVFTLFLVSSAAAQQSTPGPRDVVQSAERSVQDDSVAAVRARWTEALRRDSTDRAAALGLASLARLTYDFATAERFFNGMLARAGARWTRGRSRPRSASTASRTRAGTPPAPIPCSTSPSARRVSIGDRGGELDALIGLSGTRASSGPDRARPLDTRQSRDAFCRPATAGSAASTSAGSDSSEAWAATPE